MNTEDLLLNMVSQPPAPPLRPLRLGLRITAVLVAVLTLFLALAGLRDDLVAHWLTPVVAAKTLLPAVFFGFALPMTLRLARPGAQARGTVILALPLLLAAGLWLWSFATLPPQARFAEVSTFTVLECFGLIVLLSLLPFWFAMRQLRKGASTRPALSGGLAGLTVGAGAATGYSLFCTQDNPLFYLTFYGAAVAAVTLAGAIIGRRALAW